MPKQRSWAKHGTLLLIGDVTVREKLGTTLQQAGIAVRGVASDAAATSALQREPFAAVVVSHAMGAASISSVISHANRRHPEVPVIVLGSTPTVEEAVDVMRRGAADYLPPPTDADQLLMCLQRLLDGGKPTVSVTPATKAFDFVGLVGTSPSMTQVHATIDKISRYKTNVLLLGESGTGKELVARALHARGPRRSRLFVPLNCATLGRELLENELFGHEKGAFTGASERKKGLFELADGGTLFLDEIGEMDPSTQAKLLRVLERNEFRRVGGTEKVKVDLSVIAATNRNLPELIAAAKFREDLYYRLKVVTVAVPPLRERKEDIPALIDFFIADFNRRNNGKIKGISHQLLRRFMEYDWRGNVRELKHAVESAAILSQGQTLEDGGELTSSLTPATSAIRQPPQTAEPATAQSGDIRIPLDSTLADAERRIIMTHVTRSKSRADAARTLGIGLRTLYTKLNEFENARG
jgi:DNA-binding NtrC family response regulator